MTSFATEEDRRRLERCTGWAGLVFVVLIIPGIATELRGPDATATPTNVAATFASARTDVLVSSALLIGALTAFFVFAMGVTELGRRGDRLGLLSALSRSSAAIGIAVFTVYTAIFASLAASIHQLHNVDAVYGIFRASAAIDSSQDLFLGLFILTSALPLARAGIAGRWFTRFAATHRRHLRDRVLLDDFRERRHLHALRGHRDTAAHHLGRPAQHPARHAAGDLRR